MQQAKIGRFTITAKSPVRVKGKQGIWQVLRITDRPDAEPLVEVVHTDHGRSRVLPLSLLVYVRPSSRSGKLAASHRENTTTVANAMVPAKPIGRKAPRKTVKP